VWTNPDGFAWIEMLTDHAKVGLHAALTPTWNETAYFADLVLPMGLSSERHDITSYEQYDGQWIAFRQPVLRAARQRLGETITDTRQVNPGQVWEENEFWIELSWRIDPDGTLGIRQYFESREHPGQKLGVDEYYGWMFEHSVPGLPEAAAAEGLSPLDYMRRYGSHEVVKGVGPLHEQPVDPAELATDVHTDPRGRVYTRDPAPKKVNYAPTGAPDPDDAGRRPVGVEVDGQVLRGFPTPSGRLEFWSSTLVAWGWGEYALPTYIPSHIHPDALEDDQVPLISTFRLPTQIHTRSANSKWLDELSHANPLWIHPTHAARLGVITGDLVRVETELGHFVVKAWVTEGIRPGVVACSHHMGRWRLSGHDHGHRLNTTTRRPGPRRVPLVHAARPGPRPVHLRRPRHHPDLVDRRRRAPEHDLRSPPRPDLRDALLAPGRPRHTRPTWRPGRRHRGRHRPLPHHLPRLAGQDPRRPHHLPQRRTPTPLADPAPQAHRRRLPDRRARRPPHHPMTTPTATPVTPAAARADLLRALAAMAGTPTPQLAPVADALGLPRQPTAAEHTDLFTFQLYPYASVHLGPEGKLGGTARDRIAGFFRALNITPPPEPDHLAVLVHAWADLTDLDHGPDDNRARHARTALLHEHLQPWLPRYLQRVTELAPAPYRTWPACSPTSWLKRPPGCPHPPACPPTCATPPTCPTPATPTPTTSSTRCSPPCDPDSSSPAPTSPEPPTTSTSACASANAPTCSAPCSARTTPPPSTTSPPKPNASATTSPKTTTHTAGGPTGYTHTATLLTDLATDARMADATPESA
jgi:TorA maturation chaperone TorD